METKGTHLLCEGALHLIKEDFERRGCICCTYRLYETYGQAGKNRYSVEVSLGAETARAMLGDGFAEAARIYELLQNGFVTPCTLCDILTDLCHSPYV